MQAIRVRRSIPSKHPGIYVGLRTLERSFDNSRLSVIILAVKRFVGGRMICKRPASVQSHTRKYYILETPLAVDRNSWLRVFFVVSLNSLEGSVA